MEQRSPEWYAARNGKLTASRVSDALAKTKTGWSASRETYKGELISERLTGKPYPQFSTAAMEWGTKNEPKARSLYELYYSKTVEVGFIDHPKIRMSGASPDGFVGDDGLVEFKCPNTSTHIKTLRTKSVPGDYRQQMLWQMAVTGRLWCDFVSFDPRLPESMQLSEPIRMLRDDMAIHQMEKDVAVFLTEVENEVAVLRSEYGLLEVLKEAAE